MYELSYPWGYPPQSDLPPEEIHLAVNCLVDWMKEGVDASQLAASLLIAAYLHACMTNIGYPFRLESGVLYFGSSAPGWLPPLLSSIVVPWASRPVPFISAAILVMYQYFGNGKRVFKGLLDVATKWDANGRNFLAAVHHVFPLEIMSDISTKSAPGGGVYGHIPPTIGSEITVDGETFVYEGDCNGKAASQLGKVQINIGMAESFYHREYTYDRMGTGKRHASAREMSVEGKIIDTISAWTRRVILGIPSHSPRGRPTSAAIRRVYESLLNLATGATFGETRIWGLQSNFFDFNVYFRKLGSEGVLALHHALYEHVVMAGITRSDFFAGLSSRKRTLTHPAWNKIDQVAQQEVEKYHAACWQGVDSETTPGVPSTTSRLRIVDYFISGDRAPPVGLLPPIPASWWGKSIQHVPHYRLTKISDDGNTEVDLEAAQDRQTELVLRAGKRKRTTQRSSSPSLSAGTVSGSSSSRRPSEVKRPKEEKDGTSQTSNAPSLEKPSEESKAKPLDRKRFAALWTKDRNL